MKRENLEHVVRAAADVVGEAEIVVVGSQAILGQFPDAPDALLTSQEADVYPRGEPESAVEIDAALGDGSQFHETFGYFAHGVGPETAKAPEGWQERLVPIRVDSRSGTAREAKAWCMEAHDIVLAKCVAGRERDWEYAEEAIRHGVVEPKELLDRVADLPLPNAARNRIEKSLRGIMARAVPRS